jgi:hypothetical protein
MGDRQSDGNDKATIEEGVVGIKGDPKTLNQLSSSGRAAQQKRMGKALESLGKAARDIQTQEQGESHSGEQQGQSKGT